MKNTAAEPVPDALADGLRENLNRIEEQIAGACRAAGRPRSEVALMAVSKMHTVASIQAAVSLGARLFGENKVQEFQQKRAELGSLPEIAFHMIGHLQSNKAAKAAELFSSVDTLDSVSLAERLHLGAAKLGRRLEVLIEIRLSHEPSKAGLEPDSTELRLLLERMPDFTALDFRGLMTVPPYLEDLSAVQPYFVRLRQLREQLAAAYPRLSFTELSMGMSHDFPVAIAEGATQVRIGTALFGARNYSRV